MITRLDKNAYGKNAINLSKVIRHPDRHEIRQLTVNVSLQGEFDTVHTQGDNRNVLPTDTMKNTVYALAKDHLSGALEEFGTILSGYFLRHNPQVSEVRIELEEHTWQRMIFDGQTHPHAFVNGGSEKRQAVITQDRHHLDIQGGIKDLLILKTTDSGFENYIKDKYTTLKETPDRILATQCDILWKYKVANLDFNRLYYRIRKKLLQTFATHKSLSVQHTLYAMGENVLNQWETIKEITLKMPNKHHILFNLEPFGLENHNEIFIATDEPYGYITATLVRE